MSFAFVRSQFFPRVHSWWGGMGSPRSSRLTSTFGEDDSTGVMNDGRDAVDRSNSLVARLLLCCSNHWLFSSQSWLFLDSRLAICDDVWSFKSRTSSLSLSIPDTISENISSMSDVIRSSLCCLSDFSTSRESDNSENRDVSSSRLADEGIGLTVASDNTFEGISWVVGLVQKGVVREEKRREEMRDEMRERSSGFRRPVYIILIYI